ncbi:hypothetical protein [Chryseobacterium terrae]|uniref:Uncharacterized protein n=1 Tax=Chryseobacterium terrae TaxID=3163299 RepID=A0ABW8Y1W2_9FLAO
MKKALIFLSLFLAITIFSQSLEEKISKNICNCIGSLEKVDDPDEKIDRCFNRVFEDHSTEIFKKLRNTPDGKSGDFEDYASSIEGFVLENCVNFLRYRERDIIKTERKSLLSCNDLKIGTYYYKVLQGKQNNYLTFTEDKVIETRNNNIYSINKLEWLDNCTYKLSTLETNSKHDALNVKNKPLIFKIIENNEDNFVVQTKYYEKGGYTNVTIYKLSYLNQ